MEKFKFLNISKINLLPKASGVYCFYNGKEILYIGKATNIIERVKNHFQQLSYRDSLFINRVERIGYIKTDSEIEALILEANLIKKHQPKYNVVWRDDKNYFFVGIAKEDFPRVLITHQTKLKINYIGPFVDGKALKQTLKILRKIFPYRTCKNLPKKPCLWYQLDRCPAPCLTKPPKESKLPSGQAKLSSQIPGFKERMKEECQRNAKNLLKILQGKKNQVLANLKKEMENASNSQNYEKAAKARDQIESLERVMSHAKIFEPEKQAEDNWEKIQKILQKILKINKGGGWVASRIEAYDVSNIQGKEATGSMVTFISGEPNKNYYRRFKIKIQGKPNDVAMIKEVLKRRLGHLEWGLPDLILIDGGIAQLNAALKCKMKNTKCKMIKFMTLAKKENKLYVENRKKPIQLQNLPREIFNLILQLRDEAHRFAISYHQKLRKRVLLQD